MGKGAIELGGSVVGDRDEVENWENLRENEIFSVSEMQRVKPAMKSLCSKQQKPGKSLAKAINPQIHFVRFCISQLNAKISDTLNTPMFYNVRTPFDKETT